MSLENKSNGFSLPPAKRQKPDSTGRRFDGMQRELYSLLGENTPPVVVFENRFKERPTWNQKAVPWSWASFSNPGRKDGLLLNHWVRGRHQQDTNEYMFAKFNQKLSIPQFTREDYAKYLEDPDWAYEETRYLFDLCEEYDLRWIVIHDRYNYQRPQLEEYLKDDEEDDKAQLKTESTEDNEKNTTSSETRVEPTESTKPIPISELSPHSRTIEDLKARFYDVGRRVMKSRQKSETVGQAEDEMYRQMKYSKESEVKRKEHLECLLARSPAEIAEEEALVLESRKLEAAAEMMLLERAEILKILDAPTPTQKITEYQTSQGLTQLTGQLFTTDKTKKRKDSTSSSMNEAIQQHTQNLQYLQQQQQQLQAQHAQKLQLQQQQQQQQQSQLQPAVQETKPLEKRVKDKSEPEAASGAGGIKSTKKGIKKEKENGKKGQLTGSNAIAAAIHKKLSSKEEAAYGLSYHDKLNTGVYLRSSKIATYKQTIQTKINQVLGELGIPPRPAMPTAKVTAKFDSLQQSISVLLDAKKQADKLEAELNVMRTQKDIYANEKNA